MEKGLIQLYYGDGKGKTTAAMGSVLRAVGHGLKVLVFQFLKSPDGSGEVKILKTLPGVTYMDNTVDAPFLFNLTPEQQEYFADLYRAQFRELCDKIRSGEYDVVVLDELLDACNLGILPKEDVCRMMEEKPAGTELIITGHRYDGCDISPYIERADYVTNCKKEKHPFDRGEGCRDGIEQ